MLMLTKAQAKCLNMPTSPFLWLLTGPGLTCKQITMGGPWVVNVFLVHHTGGPCPPCSTFSGFMLFCVLKEERTNTLYFGTHFKLLRDQ